MRKHAQGAVLALAVAIGAILGPAPARADFQAGVTAYTQGDYETAFHEWQAAAEAGDVAAMRNLGHLYRWGRGVERDPRAAADWYQKAALQGLDRAMVNLAVLYLDGEGVARDPAAAAHWLQQAAAQGNADAMVRLADLLQQGLGVPRDPQEARRLIAQAAALGNETARARLDQTPSPDADAAETPSAAGPAEGSHQEETAEDDAPETTAVPAAPEPEPTPKAAQAPAPETAPPTPPEPEPETETEPEPDAEAASPAAPAPQDPPTEEAAAPAADATAAPDTAPALPPVRGAETVEGTMIHMGAYADAAAAERAWRDLVQAVPTLAQAQPHLLSGYVPGQGDLVRLYAQAPQPLMATLCARLTEAGRDCEVHRFFK